MSIDAQRVWADIFRPPPGRREWQEWANAALRTRENTLARPAYDAATASYALHRYFEYGPRSMRSLLLVDGLTQLRAMLGHSVLKTPMVSMVLLLDRHLFVEAAALNVRQLEDHFFSAFHSRLLGTFQGVAGRYSPLHDILPDRSMTSCLLQAYLAGVGALYHEDGTVFALWAPAIHVADGAVHREDGPAVVWVEGERDWFWRGVNVPQHVVEQPERITLAEIDAERNTEVQRVMIDRFGWERFDAEGGATLLDHDERWGSLFERYTRAGMRYVPVQFGNGLVHTISPTPIRYLRVVNRSPEPDGSFRRYILPVDPDLRPLPDQAADERRFGPSQKPTALNAVASTFGMTGAEYAARLAAES